jgi:hypothetical protein
VYHSAGKAFVRRIAAEQVARATSQQTNKINLSTAAAFFLLTTAELLNVGTV